MNKVLIIVARGLHLGYIGCYGNDWIDTPTLDRLAADGVVFDRHFSDRPDPSFADRAWRTGNYHLPTLDGEAGPQPERESDLFALLQAAGVKTTVFKDEQALDDTAAALAGSEQALVWVELSPLLPPWDLPESYQELYFQPVPTDEDDEPEEEDSLAPLLDPPTGRIDPDDDELFLRLQGTYAGAVSFLDAVLKQMLDPLRAQGLFEELTIILTADHGLPLGEHDFVGASEARLHEELVHLPLLVRLPRNARAGRRVAALTQSVDLVPTLLDLFGVPIPAVHGHSLVPLWSGEAEQVRPYAVTGQRHGDQVEWALRDPEWAFLLAAGPSVEEAPAGRLFVKPDDRWEVNDVKQHHLDRVEQMEQTLRAFAEAVRSPGPLTYPELPDVDDQTESSGESP